MVDVITPPTIMTDFTQVPIMSKALRDLGWTTPWSKSKERYYYFNSRTGDTQWLPPEDPTVFQRPAATPLAPKAEHSFAPQSPMASPKAVKPKPAVVAPDKRASKAVPRPDPEASMSAFSGSWGKDFGEGNHANFIYEMGVPWLMAKAFAGSPPPLHIRIKGDSHFE